LEHQHHQASGANAPRGYPANSDSREARTRADRLLLQRAHEGDQQAREQLVQRFLPLARQLARRYHRGGEALDDLTQVASLGLLKAIDRFDPTRTTAFSSFAVPTILGELKRHFRDKGWSVRVPRDLQELAVRLEPTTEALSRELGRMPTLAELAKRLDVTTEQVLEAREAAGAYRAVSLDRPRDEDDESSDGIGAAFGVEDAGFSEAEDAATVAHLMRVLSEREREVLRLRFSEDLTQAEIGIRIGVSQMHVSRIIRQAIGRLREEAKQA
jgi:RNA polymerase sigma-B factor